MSLAKLDRDIDGITQKMLLEQLKELMDYGKRQLEKDGDLTSMGKSLWHFSAISHILKNRLYCGELEYRDGINREVFGYLILSFLFLLQYGMALMHN